MVKYCIKQNNDVETFDINKLIKSIVNVFKETGTAIYSYMIHLIARMIKDLSKEEKIYSNHIKNMTTVLLHNLGYEKEAELYFYGLEYKK